MLDYEIKWRDNQSDERKGKEIKGIRLI